jgi:hypothetical protein
MPAHYQKPEQANALPFKTAFSKIYKKNPTAAETGLLNLQVLYSNIPIYS